jgi:transposase InsO family protein
VSAALPSSRGTTCGIAKACVLHRIERLMREQALRGSARPATPAQRRRRAKAPSPTTSWIGNAKRDAPNQKWVTDFTYIWTAEGWLYVAVVLAEQGIHLKHELAPVVGHSAMETFFST